MPVNVLFMEPKNFTITFANTTSKETLKEIGHLLPCKAKDIVGQCVDIFHKHPEHQRAILADPNKLPHYAKIRLGDQHMDLKVSPVMKKDGTYLGAMLTWSIITKQVNLANDFESNIKGAVETVASASTQMQSTSESMAATAEETSAQAASVSSSTEQLSESVSEIAQQVSRATEISGQVEAIQSATSHTVTSIGSITGIIDEINEISTVISAAVEEQSSATREVSNNVVAVHQASNDAGEAARHVLQSASELSKQSEILAREVDGFLEEIRKY